MNLFGFVCIFLGVGGWDVFLGGGSAPLGLPGNVSYLFCNTKHFERETLRLKYCLSPSEPFRYPAIHNHKPKTLNPKPGLILLGAPLSDSDEQIEGVISGITCHRPVKPPKTGRGIFKN